MSLEKARKSLTDEEFQGLRLALIDEMARQKNGPAKPKKAKLPKFKAGKRKTVSTTRETAPKAKKKLAENADAPAAPVADPWTLRAVDLWPTDSLRTWTPSAPMSLSDYIKDGI